MTTADPRLAALLAAVRANPRDWDARRVLADAYEEAGEHVLANGQRWQARKKKLPWYGRYALLLPQGPYYWWFGNHTNERSEYRLSDRLLVPMGWNGERERRLPRYPRLAYAKCDSAEATLARALWDLGILVRSDDA